MTVPIQPPVWAVGHWERYLRGSELQSDPSTPPIVGRPQTGGRWPARPKADHLPASLPAPRWAGRSGGQELTRDPFRGRFLSLASRSECNGEHAHSRDHLADPPAGPAVATACMGRIRPLLDLGADGYTLGLAHFRGESHLAQSFSLNVRYASSAWRSTSAASDGPRPPLAIGGIVPPTSRAHRSPLGVLSAE